MKLELPVNIRNDNNCELLKYLDGKSCHGDIIGPIQVILENYENVEFFCADLQEFKYCIWYTNSTIFAFASGMHSIHLRLPPVKLNNEKITGEFLRVLDAQMWWAFAYNSNDLPFWVEKSYAYARES